MGKLLAICTSPKRGTVKTEVPSAVLTPEWGIVEDAHGGNWHRQVSMLSAEKIEAFRKKIWVDYGAFGENLVIEGFDFRKLPVTSRFAIGDVVLEMTQIGKECHNDCVIKQQTGECIMPHEGVFARVLTGGEIHVGDEVTLLPALETADGAVRVDADMQTNIPGVFAAGDITGAPYQAARAVGQGNTAALSIARFLHQGDAINHESTN